MLIPFRATLLCALDRFLRRFGLSTPPFGLSLRIVSEDRVAAFARRDKGRPSRLDLCQSVSLRPCRSSLPFWRGRLAPGSLLRRFLNSSKRSLNENR
jgi:hypothetical protein